MKPDWPLGIIDRLYESAMRRVTRRFVTGDVLNVGCGTGRYQPMLARRARRYLPVDLPQSFSGVPRAVAFMDGCRLAFRAATFDVAVSTFVIEHVFDTLGFLREQRRVVRPGGHVVVAYSHISPVNEAPHDYHRFTRFFFERLASLGLRLVAHENCGDFFALFGMLVATAADRLLPRRCGGMSIRLINEAALWLQHRVPGKSNFSLGGVAVLQAIPVSASW